jgi:hypothetical protein
VLVENIIWVRFLMYLKKRFHFRLAFPGFFFVVVEYIWGWLFMFSRFLKEFFTTPSRSYRLG